MSDTLKVKYPFLKEGWYYDADTIGWHYKEAGETEETLTGAGKTTWFWREDLKQFFFK